MKTLISLFFLFCSSFVFAFSMPLPADQAFQVNTQISNSQQLEIHFNMVPGYHLYQERVFIHSNSNNITLNKFEMPPSELQNDPVLGVQHIYDDNLDLFIPITINKIGNASITVEYQGCKGLEFCYPKQIKTFAFNIDSLKINKTIYGKLTTTAPHKIQTVVTKTNDQSFAEKILVDQSIIGIFFAFLGLGLLLAFTPCVLPMVPILSGIIIGHGHNIKTNKAFCLSLIYVLAMSLTYACLGLLVGLAGENVQIFMQQPIVIIAFSLIFVLLALSLFGFYDLQLPQFLQNKLNNVSQKQKGGSYISVAIMGVLATLIVSPCVSAPLLGALVYIAHTGNAFIGFLALFALGIGMGIPLLIIGTSAGSLLPKVGHWMETIKSIFGVIMLGFAIYLLERILSAQIIMFLWAALLIMAAIFMGALDSKPNDHWEKFKKGIGILFIIYGLIIIFGALKGQTDPLHPFLVEKNKIEKTMLSSIPRVTSIKQVNAIVEQSSNSVLIDFYADWCIACKEFDRNTLEAPEVQKMLNSFTFIKANITSGNQDNKALMKKYGIIAPPSFIIVTKAGEIHTLAGNVNKQEFLTFLKNAE